MYRLIVIFATIIAVTSATPFLQCKGKPAPVGIRVKGCDKLPCKVVKGTSGHLEVDFTAPHSVTALTTKVRTTALGITLPYFLPKKVANVCNNLLNGGNCPLDAGEDATYAFALPILRIYPSIQVYVEVSMVDQNNVPINCFGVDIQVVSQ